MNRNAYVLLLLTTLFWGGNAVAGKLAVGHVSPMLLTCSRWALACAILLAFGWRRLKAGLAGAGKRNILPMLSPARRLGFTVFNVALYSALNYTTAINVSIEQAGMPMLIFLLNFILFHLRVTWAQIVGFVVSLAGVILTAAHGEPARLLDLDVNFGDALMLIAVLVYAAYTVGCASSRPQVHWKSLMIVLTAPRPRHVAALRGRIRLGRRHSARRARLGDHCVCGGFSVDPGADLLHPRRRTDRRQPRRPVHQPRADLRHAALHRPSRRGVPLLPRRRHGAGARRHLAGGNERRKRSESARTRRDPASADRPWPSF